MDEGTRQPSPSERDLFGDGRGRWRVYWVPQIPMRPFHYEVPDYRAGVMLEDALGKYDLFQFENNVKPDYCNMGGVQWSHPVLTEGEWWDMDEDEAEYFGLRCDLPTSPDGSDHCGAASRPRLHPYGVPAIDGHGPCEDGGAQQSSSADADDVRNTNQDPAQRHEPGAPQ
jgi:hypothetical protein